MEPWQEEAPPPGTVGYTNKGFGKPPPLKPVDPVFTMTEGNEKPRSKCGICAPLGLPGNHPTNICFGNPENPQCKNNVVRSRMLQAQKFSVDIEEFRGKAIPPVDPNPENLPNKPSMPNNPPPDS
jgi:hypothetical protein